MSSKSLFKWFITIVVLAAPCAAQTKSGSQTSAKTSAGSVSKPSQGKTTQSATLANDGRNTTSTPTKPAVAPTEAFQPSLKITNLNLLDASRELSTPGKKLVIDWNVILNRFDGVLTNKINSQDVELVIQRSRAGSRTVNQSLAATSTNFSLTIPHDEDESVSVSATVRARCTVSNNGVTSAVTLSDTGSIRRDPVTASAGNFKAVEVTILKVANEDARAQASAKGTRRVVPVRIEWKTRPWQDAKLVALRAELTTTNSDGSRGRVEKALGLTQTSEVLMLELPEGVLAREFKLRIVATCSFDENGKPATGTSEAIKSGKLIARSQ